MGSFEYQVPLEQFSLELANEGLDEAKGAERTKSLDKPGHGALSVRMRANKPNQAAVMSNRLTRPFGLSCARAALLASLLSCSEKTSESTPVSAPTPTPPTAGGGALPQRSALAKTAARNVSAIDARAVDVSVGYAHVCAALANGRVACWGSPVFGALGSDPKRAGGVVLVPGITDASSVHARNHHSCALHQSGRVTCWGDNGFHQTGAHSGNGVTTLVRDGAKALALGDTFSCVLMNSGEVRCVGRVRPSASETTRWATPLRGMPKVESIAAGKNTLCGAKGAKTWCVGRNFDRLVGLEEPTYHNVVAAPALRNLRRVAMGYSHSCGLRGKGHVVCLGSYLYGRRGDGKDDSVASPTGKTKRVTSGGQRVDIGFAENADDLARWGEHLERRGARQKRATRVVGVKGAVELAAGWHHTCARAKTGRVWCWGKNEHGQLGNKTHTTTSRPVSVSGLVDAVAIDVSDNVGCAVKKNGSVWCWGSGKHGLLGPRREAGSSVPVKVLEVRSTAAEVRSTSAAVKSTDTPNVDGPLAITKAGSRTPLPHAVARVREGALEIAIGSDRPPACASDVPWVKNTMRAQFRVHPGPGGTFFAGRPFGVLVTAAGSGFSPAWVRIELEPFNPSAGPVKGRVVLPRYGGGSFSATLCKHDSSAFHALPDSTPKKKISGVWRDKPFVAQSVLATLSGHGDHRFIASIHLFPNKRLRCSALAQKHDAKIILTDLGGTAEQAPILGSPQPVRISYNPVVYGWVQFDKLAFRAGKTMRGRFAASSHPATPASHRAELAGRFTATVCPTGN